MITFNIEISLKAKQPVLDNDDYEAWLEKNPDKDYEDWPEKVLYTEQQIEQMAKDTIIGCIENDFDVNHHDGAIPYSILDNLQVDSCDYNVSDFIELKVNGEVIKCE